MDELTINSPPVKLMISLFIAYPISIIYSIFFVNASKRVKLIYQLVLGIVLICFNYGFDIAHSLITCFFCYAVLKFANIKIALAVNFIVPMVYLVVGCYLTQIGANYSLTWTLPQCVLTLRLIAVTFDVYDGLGNQMRKKKDEKAQLVNSDSALDSTPTLLEFLSHNYFPATVLVGPLIPFRQYMTYIESDVNHLPKCWTIALTRLLVGILYLVIFQFGSQYFPSDYLLTQDYFNANLCWRLTAIALVAKISMSKYLASWLISEGACIVSGVAYDGESYYSCANIYVVKFETTPTFGGIIKSFNLKTNAFAAKHVYKRLKFFGNRHVSQGLTLLFLAIWHGIDTGYFMTFGMEFLIMLMETQITGMIKDLSNKSDTVKQILDNKIVQIVVYILLKTYLIYLLGYSFVTMMLVKYRFWFPVLRAVYFYGHVITIGFAVTSIFYKI